MSVYGGIAPRLTDDHSFFAVVGGAVHVGDDKHAAAEADRRIVEHEPERERIYDLHVEQRSADVKKWQLEWVAAGG